MDGLLSDDDLFGAAPAASGASSLLSDDDLFGSATTPEGNPFAGESFGDLASRRAQQAAAGLGESFAAVPEAVAVGQAEGDRRTAAAADVADARSDSYDENLRRIEARAAEIERALGINGNPRPSRENRLDTEQRAALEREYAEIAAQRGQISVAAGSGGTGATRAEAALDRDSATIDGEVVPASERDIFGYGQRIRDFTEDTFGKPDPRDTGLWSQVFYGAGTVTGMAGTALASAAVGGPAAALTVGAAQGAAMNASAIYNEAVQAGADEEVAREAASIAALVGASEIIPISRALNLLPRSLRVGAQNALMRRVIAAGQGAAEESVQEALVTVANNLIAQNYYDPERGWNEEVGQAALVGAILGGALGGTVGAPARADGQDEPPADPATSAPVETADTGAAETAALQTEPANAAPAPATDVAPDEAVALGVQRPEPEDIVSAFGQEVADRPAPEPAVTPEVTQDPEADPEAAMEQSGDLAETVPETADTLERQTQDLLSPTNARYAVFIPDETSAQPDFLLPEGLINPPRTIRAMELPNGTLYFDTRRFGVRDIRAQIAKGKLNEVLGLGPYNKTDVAASVAQGSPETAVVERAPDGTEVRAAAGTEALAPEQVAAMQPDAAPDSTLSVETPEEVITARAEPTAPTAPPASINSEIRAGVDGSVLGFGDAGQQTPQPEAPKPLSRAERAKQVARERMERMKREMLSAPPTVAGPEVAPTVEVTAPQPEQPRMPVEPIAQEPIQPAAQPAAQPAQRGGARPKDKTASGAARRAEAAEGRTQTYAEIDERVRRRELTPEQEQRERDAVAGTKKGDRERKAKNARIAGELLEEFGPKEIGQVSTPAEKAALRDRLAALVDAATDRGFVFSKRPGSPATADAVVWLHQAKMVLGKLRGDRMTYAEINQFLVDEAALSVQGDASLLRGTRKEKGREVAAPAGADASNVAAPATAEGSPDDDVGNVSLDEAASETEGDTSDAIPETTFADEGEISARATASKTGGPRTSARSDLISRARVARTQLESMGFTQREIEDVIANEPVEAEKIIAEAQRRSVRSVSDEERAAIAARYGSPPAKPKPKSPDPAPGEPGVTSQGIPAETVELAAEPAPATVYRARPVNVPEGTDGVGQAVYGIGDYWSSSENTASRYRQIVRPVTLIGPHGQATLNLRDALGDRRKLEDALQKIGVSKDLRENIVTALASGNTGRLPDQVSAAVGDAEVTSVEIDTSKYVPQTAKGRYNEYDLNNPIDVQKLKDQGVEGTIYTDESGATNYVTFPANIRGVVRAMLRDGARGSANAVGARVRDGSEAHEALQTTTLADMKAEVENSTLPLGLRESFSPANRKQQDAVGGMLYTRLSAVAGDVPVYILDSDVFDLYAPNADAYYNPDGDYIVIREETALDQDAAMHVMLHEGSHAAMEGAMQRDPALRKQADELRKIAKAHADKIGYTGSRYGFENASEFMAEVWSNPQFREMLSRAPVTKGQLRQLGIKPAQSTHIKNMLSVIKSMLARVLGIRGALTSAGYDAETKSVLEASMDVAGALLEAAQENRLARQPSEVLPMARRAQDRNDKRALKDPMAAKLAGMGVDTADAARAAEAIAKDPVLSRGMSEQDLEVLAERLKRARELDPDERKRIEKSQKELSARLKKQRSAVFKKVAEADKEVQDALDKEFVPGTPPRRPRLLKLATFAQIARAADRYFGGNNPVRKIALLVEKRRLRREALMQKAEDAVKLMAAAERRHSPEQWQQFSSLLNDVTMADVHPDVPLSDPKNKHIQKGGVIKKGPNKGQEKGARDAWKRRQHAKLSARYQALPDDLKQVYARTRDLFTDTQNEMSLRLMENVLRMIGVDDAAMAKRLHEGTETQADRDALGEDVMRHMENAAEIKKINGAYFPLMRRGDYVLTGSYQIATPPGAKRLAEGVFQFTSAEQATAFSQSQDLRSSVQTVYVDKNTGSRFGKDRDGSEVRVSKGDPTAEARYEVTVQTKYVEFFDSLADARAAEHDLLKEPVPGAPRLTLRGIEARRPDNRQQNGELVSSQMMALSRTVEKRAAARNLSKDQQAEVIGALREVSLQFLGSTRIQSHRLPRRNVQGASRDATRNAFEYMQSSAGYLAKLETSVDMNAALAELETRTIDVSSRSRGSGLGVTAIRNEVVDRIEKSNAPEQPNAFTRNADRLLALSFANYLFSPAYSLINATQPGVVGLPILAARFNPAKSAAALTKAYLDMGALATVGGGLADTARAAVGGKVRGDRLIDNMKQRLNPKEREMIDVLIAQGRIDTDAGLEVQESVKRSRNAGGRAVDAFISYSETVARALPRSIEVINRAVMSISAYRLAVADGSTHEQATKIASDVVEETQGMYSNTNAAPIFTHPVGRIALQFMKYPQLVLSLYGTHAGNVLRPMNKGDRARGVKAIAYMTASHTVVAGLAGATFWEALKIPLFIFSSMGLTDLSWDDFEEEVEEALANITGSETLANALLYGMPTLAGVDVSSRMGLQNILTFGEPRGNDAESIMGYLLQQFGGAGLSMVVDQFVGARALVDEDYVRAAERLLPWKFLADGARAYNQVQQGNYDSEMAALRVFGLMPAQHATVNREIGRDIRADRAGNPDRRRLERVYLRAGNPADRARAAAQIRLYNRGVEANQRINIPRLDRRVSENRARWEN